MCMCLYSEKVASGTPVIHEDRKNNMGGGVLFQKYQEWILKQKKTILTFWGLEFKVESLGSTGGG